jgi:hypothetical protein
MLERAAEDNKQFVETLKSMHPIGRIGDPEEIGHTLLVDGGVVSR